jgi:hypothetical protein
MGSAAGRDEARAEIELAIERARDGVEEKIDAIDRRIRTQLDFGKMASEYAPQLVVAGAAFGFLLGFGIPKVLVRTVQIGIPIYLAIRIAKKKVQQQALS